MKVNVSPVGEQNSGLKVCEMCIKLTILTISLPLLFLQNRFLPQILKKSKL